MELKIVYKDQYIVAIHKPAGIMVHRSEIDRNEKRYILQLLRDQIGQFVYPVHRLDRPTSGLMIFALSSEVANQLSKQFSNRTLEKKYWAIVRGYVSSEGIIDYPLRYEADKKSKVKQNATEAQDAITSYRLLECFEIPVCVDKYPKSRYSLVECCPKTGRKHQIRRHLRHLGHPIIGDTTHGVTKHNHFFKKQLNYPRMFLACIELSFDHPNSGERLTLREPVSEDMSECIKVLRNFTTNS